MTPPSVLCVLVLFGAGTLPAQLSISNDPVVPGATGAGQPGGVPMAGGILGLPTATGPALPAGTAPMPGIAPGNSLLGGPMPGNASLLGGSMTLPSGTGAPPGASSLLGGPILGNPLGGAPSSTSPLGPAMGTPNVGTQARPAPSMPSASTPEERATVATQAVQQYLNAGQMQQAFDAAAEALKLAEADYGPQSLQVARRRMDIALILRMAGQYNDSMNWGEKAVGLEQIVGDKQSVEYALDVQRLGEIYLDVGQKVAAQRAFTQSYDILKTKLPEKHPDVATAIHNLGTISFLLQMPDAKPLLTKALALRTEIHGADSTNVALTAGMLSKCYLSEKDFAAAETLTRQALDIYRKQGASAQVMIFRLLDDLCTTLMRAGRTDDAEKYLVEAESGIRETLGEEHSLFTTLIARRAELTEVRGDMAETERLYQSYLERVRKHDAPGSANILAGHMVLATFYTRNSSPSKAEACYRDALKEVETAVGPDSGAAVEVWRYLADFYYRTMFNYDQAESCLRRLLTIQTEKLRINGDPIAMTELAQICRMKGRDKEAVTILRKVLAQEKASPSPNASAVRIAEAHPKEIETGADAIALNRLAIAHHTKLLREAEQQKRTDANAAKDVAFKAGSLAHSYLAAGEPAAAEKFARQSQEISRRMVSPLNLTHQESARCLIYALYDMTRDKEADQLLPQWFADQQVRLEEILTFATKEDRLSWLMNQQFYELPASLRKPRETALMLLRTKGIHIDIENVARAQAEAAATEGGKTLWDRLTALRSKSRNEVNQSVNLTERQNRVSEMDDIERKLMALAGASGSSVRSLLSATLEQVQSRLREDAAVVDYFTFACRERGGNYTNRYGAIVLRRDKEPVLYVTKHTRGQVDELSGYFRAAMREQGDRQKKDAALESLHHTFYEMVFSPLEKELKGVKTLYICPDEQLQFVPFAALLDGNNRFLAERFDIRHISTTRDLLREPSQAAADKGRIAIFASANYQSGSRAAGSRGATKEEKSRLADFISERNAGMITPLPGTAQELALIKGRSDAAGWKSEVFRGDEAREPRLRELAAPDCLHFATHGYFLVTEFELAALQRKAQQRRDPRQPDNSSVVDFRMDRSGVLLAGAQDSLTRWRQGMTVPTDDDGFLTAEEVIDLNLHGTRLVFLSACDTGVGVGSTSSGIMGLRSAFLHAGARHVISTLWPIPDAETAGLVGEFYGKYFAEGDIGKAFHQTQRDWLVRVRQSDGLWEAVRQAGAFMLVSTNTEK